MNKLVALLGLYFAQGLPFGVQATALPLLLRERGASLEMIGFSSLLSVPWLAKALWAPLVDRYGNQRFGRRKSWIVPMQLGLALTALVASFTHSLALLAGLVLAMNFFAATQDIAVDALAVGILEPDQLGPANAIQVVGYKLGMLTGGGLLVWAGRWIGWNGLFVALAGLMLAVLLMTLAVRESNARTVAEAPLGAREIGLRMRDALRQPSTVSLLVVMLTYKMGESMADTMWKPMLLDRGFVASDIGLWAGTFGMACSLLGSASSGLLLRRVSEPRALTLCAGFRALSVLAEWWVSVTPRAGAGSVIAVTCVEHLAGGAITTIVFALMMRHTDRQIGATHYTLLASVEVLGKLPLTAFSGVLASALGYPGLFGVSALLCIGFSVLAAALAPALMAGADTRLRQRPAPL